MTEKEIEMHNELSREAGMRHLLQEHLGQADGPDTPRMLRRDVRRAMRVIRHAYRRAATSGHGGFAEWLSDNYHLLIREGEAVYAELRHAREQPLHKGKPAVYTLFAEWLELRGMPEEAELGELLQEAEKQRPLTVFELTQLPLCMRAALLQTAADACTAPAEEAEEKMALAVTGLRQMADFDFSALTERYSIVERILQKDPAGVYPRMDENSREMYRQLVAREAIAQGKSETAVAADVIEAAEQGDTVRTRHVGEILLHLGDHKRLARGRALMTASLVLPLLVSLALAVGIGSPIAILLAYLPAYELLRPFIEWLGMQGVPAARLPRMELDGVIPEEGRTVIAVSALLPQAAKAEKTAQHLADLYNTNGRGAVQVCLLADLKQAAYPEMPQDGADIAAMRRQIRRLNRRYGEHFVLAVRRRTYSKTMDAYTGYERKRGAILQLSQVITGTAEADGGFLAIEGDMAALRRSRYLLALDADTGLLLDTLPLLVGTALHPCNEPVLDEERRRVVKGYGVLTPRIGLELGGADKTGFARTMAGVGGVTPYDVLSGDLYMDLFSSTVFSGKGLLDIRAFAAVSAGAFPEEQVLSHDILEGCLLRAGYVSDVEMVDGFPASMVSWLKRLHRWVRGDWQNAPFLRRDRLPLTRLDRWKLLDNLRRSLTPAVLLLCILVSPLLPHGQVMTLFALLAAVSGQLLTMFSSLLHGGWQSLSGRYYSRVMPRAMNALMQMLYTVVMLPATALIELDAALRALWRLHSRRRMLEWTTAADAEHGAGSWAAAIRLLWPTLFPAAIALIWGFGLTRLTGVFFAVLIPTAVLSARPGKAAVPQPTAGQREQIAAYAAAAWRYYAENCTVEEHFLPPDNLQESPVWRVAHRTSPTNIGLYLLCIRAAADFGLIDQEEMLRRVDETLGTVERLEKWRGNLLNWYDTRTLRPLHPQYVSTVDSGNFLCCLVALRQGLMEVHGTEALCRRMETLLRETDLKPLYDRHRALFYIGLDPETGRESNSYYDLLMSESRMTGYYAIASRIVPKKHWGALGRLLTRSGGYVGPVSWTGTMFEYFMPRLLLPAPDGSMSYEALRFCLRCQQRRPPHGVPWGISESGFYAFDGNLNYQYKAHGVPRLGLKRGLAADMVISPYSSFLTLTTAPAASLQNLSRLERLGMTGRCGFYEAADFTPGRAARGGYSVVRSYMAHHVGMSLLACANAMFDDIFVRRFMRDDNMKRAAELLEEKPPVNGAVYAGVQERVVPDVPGRTASMVERFDTVNPRTPHVQLLSGGEWMLAVTDTGAGISCCRGLDMTWYSADLLRRPQGVFVLVDGGEGAFPVTRAPDYWSDAAHQAEFGAGYAAFYAQKGSLEAGMRVVVHPHLPCEQRQIAVKNRTAVRQKVRVTVYFEPCLARREDAGAHPAFSRLFLTIRYDPAARALFAVRRQRTGEAPVCLAAGFLDGTPFAWESSRERLLRRPHGVGSLTEAAEAPLDGRGTGVPDSAAALQITLELPPHGQRIATLALTAAPTETEAAARLIALRQEGALSVAKAAPSPFGGVEGQLAVQILPDLLYPPRISREWAEAARRNELSQPDLWPMGISGDYPLVLIEVHNAADASRAEPYMRLHRSLRLGGLTTELAVVYSEGGDYDTPVLSALKEAARAVRCEDTLGIRGGIHLINRQRFSEETLRLLTAVCAHNGARDLQRTGLPPAEYKPVRLRPVERVEPEAPAARLSLPGGVFSETGFTVTERPNLPWCHVLANPTFGTLVSDCALGYSWAVNARENKLTPWYNDTASDNRGEMLLLRSAGKIWDTVCGAGVLFGADFARYTGRAGEIRTTVTVRVPPKGMWKEIELELINEGEETAEVQAAYYTEPVLGVDRRFARHIKAKWENGGLLLRQPFGGVKGTMLLTAEGGADGCDCDRGSFLAGSWGGGTLSPLPDPCAAVVVRRELPPRRREKIRFILGFAAQEAAAVRYPQLRQSPPDDPAIAAGLPEITLPDEALSALCTGWIARQALVCRIYARTAFYQCGGAWGFRDQLQDSLGALWLDPQITRRQLMRCAAVQFEEGDVLHWWHRLPGSLRGVRTRCSDDLVWLPFAACVYAAFTGDEGIWDVQTSWLTGDPLTDEEQERYFAPSRTVYRSSLYIHAVRALDKACTAGAHGLPLIGSGDWNDGFNRLGAQGRGESVWLAMFLRMTLLRMAPVCEARGETERAAQYRERAQAYRLAAEECFAGDRYLRAFDDEGRAVGREGEAACALDSLPQSFAAFSGMDPQNTAVALDTAFHLLADRESGTVQLFTPAFAEPDRAVGYTSAYPAGVRENGGQYTHAAVWLAMALLESGRAVQGVELLRLLNPAEKWQKGRGGVYRGEPYALAGDVYHNRECPGRAGWTQYTGAAGWYLTAVLHGLLGLRPEGKRLYLTPRLPEGWPGYSLRITLRATPLHITAQCGLTELTVDGAAAQAVPLDGRPHEVRVPAGKSGEPVQ